MTVTAFILSGSITLSAILPGSCNLSLLAVRRVALLWRTCRLNRQQSSQKFISPFGVRSDAHWNPSSCWERWMRKLDVNCPTPSSVWKVMTPEPSLHRQARLSLPLASTTQVHCVVPSALGCTLMLEIRSESSPPASLEKNFQIMSLSPDSSSDSRSMLMALKIRRPLTKTCRFSRSRPSEPDLSLLLPVDIVLYSRAQLAPLGLTSRGTLMCSYANPTVLA